MTPPETRYATASRSEPDVDRVPATVMFTDIVESTRCAAAISGTVLQLGIVVRSGLHTGEIELKLDDVAGIAVHIAARVAAEAEAGETVVSSTVRDLVAGSRLRFQDRGTRALKGLFEEVQLYRVIDAR